MALNFSVVAENISYIYTSVKANLERTDVHCNLAASNEKVSSVSADSGHSAHEQSIIQAFSLHSYILFTESKGRDQTVRMRRLILAFTVRICPKIGFRMGQPVKQLKLLYTLSDICLL